MKKYLIATVTMFSMQAFTAQGAETLYMCSTPDNEDIGYVSVSHLKRGNQNSYYLAIEWLRPKGRQDVEEVEADEMSDFTVNGYDSVDGTKALRFYTADDPDGERDVLELDGKEIPVKCKWVGPTTN